MKDSNTPATSKNSTRATDQDVLDAPLHMVAEIIDGTDGTLYTHPRSSPPHVIASSGLGGRINPPSHFGDGGSDGWWILNPSLSFFEE